MRESFMEWAYRTLKTQEEIDAVCQKIETLLTRHKIPFPPKD